MVVHVLWSNPLHFFEIRTSHSGDAWGWTLLLLLFLFCNLSLKTFFSNMLHYSLTFLLPLFTLLTKTKTNRKQIIRIKTFLTDSQPGYVLSMFLKIPKFNRLNLSLKFLIKKVVRKKRDCTLKLNMLINQEPPGLI